MRGQVFSGNTRSTPLWAGGRQEPNPLVQFPAKLDPAQFVDSLGILITTTGIAAIGATSIPITALPTPVNVPNPLNSTRVGIPKGAILFFGAAGSGKFAKVTADVNFGAVAIPVEALVTALASGDTSIYSPFGTKFIPSGTFLGRTRTERDAGTGFGPWAVSDEEEYLLMFDIVDANMENDCELYDHNNVVKENYLPGWSSLSGTVQARIRALYTCITGVD